MNSLWYVPCNSKDAMIEDYEIAVPLNVKNDEPVDAKLFWQGPRKAWLKLSVLQGKDFPPMDPTGKADPYCIVKFGDEEHFTSIQYRTVEPVWNQTFIFEVDNIPQTAFSFPLSTVNNSGVLQLSQIPLCELLYYIYIDVWDKDTLNRDDYMGRVIIPVSSIEVGTSCKWYPVGRTPSSPAATGRIELSITLKSLDDAEPLPRWCIDDLLIKDGEKCANFQLPIKSEDQVVRYPGTSEHVELVIDDVLVEVSGHRGLGRIFLTDYRLVILCTDASSTNLAKTSDLSMWVPLNLITSVERGDEQKVIRKTESGNAGVTDVKTLVLKCEDFRTIRFTFLKSKPNVHSYLETKTHTLDEVKELEEDIEDLSPILDRTLSVASKADVTLGRKKEMKRQDTSILEAVAVDNKPKSGCVSRMFHIFHKRLKFIVWNANRFPPAKAFMSCRPDFYLNGWDVYNPELEFQRQEISESWKLSKLNGDYSISHSYPKYMYVPSSVKDADIEGSAIFRSKGRIPSLTWFHKSKKTFIMRCSQPKIGTMGKFSVEDENFVQAARHISPTKRLVIFDARSMLAAGGNRLKGKGTEDIVNRYHGMKLLFLDIANIHAMRDSIDKLQTVCESVQENKWLSQLESTQWLSHIRSVLKGAALLAHYVTEKNTSVLVHCSDGWDRTPQLTALAQILLDPYYRTFDGFKVLVMKDWISFGHRFSDRLGDPLAPSQRSPVFLQFLDCVCQILIQFPSCFEFTQGYLVRIAEHLNSGWFGNFLCNTLKEREQENIVRTTVSIWAHLDAMQEEFRNPQFKPTEETLMPICSLRRLYFWNEYYLRFDDVAFSGVEALEDFEDTKELEDLMSPANTVVWVPDERVRECHDCKQKFTGIRRRHHCRACGQVFCGGCTRHRARLPYLGYNSPERVCDVCWVIVSKVGSDEEDEYEIITEEPSTIGCF